MSEVTRRDFLKAIIPLGWAPEAVKAGGLGKLSGSAKVSLIKDVAILIPAAAKFLMNETEKQSLKDKVLSFRWEQAKGKELEGFVSDLADEYLRLTKTTRVSKADLTGSGKLNFYQNREQMTQAVKQVEPSFSPTQNQWGFTHFITSRVFIDLGTLKDQTSAQAVANRLNPNNVAGMALLGAIWHEWGHLDVTERNQGKYLNNPKAFFNSPNSGKNEQFKKYRGMEVFTETYFGFKRFEEVLNETITVRRMIEQVGLERVFSAADYNQNGVDFFPLFTNIAQISLDTLYQKHATSDFEGIAVLIGQQLPGDGDVFEKGIRLMVGVHRSDADAIRQTGVFNINSRRR